MSDVDADAPDNDPPYELRPSGVVYVTVDGRTRTLRRPTLGEFRRFREAHHEANLEVTRAGAKLRTQLVELNDELLMYAARAQSAAVRDQRLHILAKLGDDIDPNRRAERDRLEAGAKAGPLTEAEVAAQAEAEVQVQRVMSDVDDIGLAAWGGWTAGVLQQLGVIDAEYNADDLDPALCSVDFTVALIEHWRSVTPPRGR
jgi:hypothetical protein